MSGGLQEFLENISKSETPVQTGGPNIKIEMPRIPEPEIPKLPPDLENKLNYLERIATALERIAKILEESNKKVGE